MLAIFRINYRISKELLKETIDAIINDIIDENEDLKLRIYKSISQNEE